MQGGQQESRWWEHLERVLSLSGATREADVGGNSRGKRFLGKKRNHWIMSGQRLKLEMLVTTKKAVSR